MIQRRTAFHYTLSSILLTTAMGCSSASHSEKTEAQSSSPAEDAIKNIPNYRLFIPTSAQTANSAPAPLLVLIHGCLQSAEAMESGTQMDQVAEKNGFAVLYPDQTRGRHPLNCWQWFLKENQRPNSGELGEILAMIQDAKTKLTIDSKRIFVAGLSSGSGISAALLACHPDVFAGGALHSGPAYGYVDNEEAAKELLKNGPPKQRSQAAPCAPANFGGRLLVIQGTGDKVVNPANADRLFADFKSRGAKSSLDKNKWPATNKETYPTLVTCRKNHGRIQACELTINGLGHAWSGGAPKKPFMDSEGPSVNEVIARFLINGENSLK